MPPICTPTDNGATDGYSDGCAEYARDPNTCGNFDTPNFNSMDMCCACGGGSTVSPPASPPRVLPFPPPGSPPARPPLLPGHISLSEGEDLLSLIASGLEEVVIELEPEQLYITGPIRVGAKNISITISSLAPDGFKPAIIELDSEEAFASVEAGGSLLLSGVNVARSNRSEARRRRRLAAGESGPPLVENHGGSVYIHGSVLQSKDSTVLNSMSGDVTIEGSFISGHVLASEGNLTLRDSSFDGASPLVTGGSNAQLLVGSGTVFNFSGVRPMAGIVQTDNPAQFTFLCVTEDGCQVSTSEVAAETNVCSAGSAADDSDECQLCSPGTYTDVDDQTECRNCSGGFYQEAKGQTTCDPCPLGHACPNGSATPVQCATGHFADTTKLSECKPCEDGRYCAAGSFKGLLCGRGNYCPPEAGSMTQCPAGRYGADEGLNSSLCSGPCDPGHYCLNGSMSPQSQACPAGTFNGSQGLKSVDACTECPAGTACPSGSTAATNCAPGTVANASGMEACVKCIAGKYQVEPGELTCDVCKPGSYCEAGANALTRCPAGSYSAKVGAGNVTDCTQCAAGNACPSGSTEPTRCQPGSVQNLVGQETCNKCAAGTFQSNRGRQECDDCTLGGYCMKGSSSPSPCAAGRFGNLTGLKTLHECFYCEPGSSCALGAQAPTPCTPGSIASVDRYAQVLARTLPASNLSKCEACEPGTYQDVEGQVQCKPCKRGGYCGAGAATTASCPAGSYGGAESLVSSADCTNCSEGTSCPVGATEETPCSAGFHTNESALTLADRRRCIKCIPGKFQTSVKQTECQVCETGGYCSPAAAAVTPCDGGSYNNRTGQKNKNVGCLPTEPGFYASTASSKQTPCAAGSVAPNASMGTCAKCAAGTFQNEEGKEVCKPCDAGRYCEAGASVALPCKAGTYSTATDLKVESECTPSTPGSYATTDSTEQNVCSPGTVAPSAGMGKCDKCAAGKFQPDSGQAECKPCELGHYCPEGASAALPCKDGTYSKASNTTSKDTCLRTEPGYYATAGSPNQTPCSPGTVAPNASMGTCIRCLAGAYQDELGKPVCKPCKAGVCVYSRHTLPYAHMHMHMYMCMPYASNAYTKPLTPPAQPTVLWQVSTAKMVRVRRCRAGKARTPRPPILRAWTSAWRPSQASSRQLAARCRCCAAPARYHWSLARQSAPTAPLASTGAGRRMRQCASHATQDTTAQRGPAPRCLARRARTPRRRPTSSAPTTARRPRRATTRQPAAPNRRNARPARSI